MIGYPYRNYAIKMVSQPTRHLIYIRPVQTLFITREQCYTTGVEQTSASLTTRTLEGSHVWITGVTHLQTRPYTIGITRIVRAPTVGIERWKSE